jgi:hypothetical protein
LWAFSGADLSRARFLTRSSKTLDREHRWNNAGFERRGLSGEKNGKKTSSAKNTELEKRLEAENATARENPLKANMPEVVLTSITSDL